MTTKTTARQLLQTVADTVVGFVQATNPDSSAALIPPTPTVKKTDFILALLRQPNGAVLADLMAATGWQAHSVRSAISGIKKKFGAALVIEKVDGRGRVYRLAGEV